jgi:hypothetical protein
MPAVMKINQIGIVEGTADVSRSDGLMDGSEVEIINVYPGAINKCELVSAPTADDEAVSSFGEYEGAWYFTPKRGVWGSYRFRLIVDGAMSEREFAIRSPSRGLRCPTINTRANPAAHLANLNPVLIRQCIDNENDNAFGWWPDLEKLFLEVENAGGEQIRWVNSSQQIDLSYGNQLVMADSENQIELFLPGTDEYPFRTGSKIRLCQFNTGWVRFGLSEMSAHALSIFNRPAYESTVSFQGGEISAVLIRSVLDGFAEDIWWVSGDLKAAA